MFVRTAVDMQMDVGEEGGQFLKEAKHLGIQIAKIFENMYKGGNAIWFIRKVILLNRNSFEAFDVGR